MDSSCWDILAQGLLQNLPSDLIVGGILGFVAALWVGRRLNSLESAEQRRQEKKAAEEKAVRYLGLLKEEVERLTPRIPALIDTLQQAEPGRGAIGFPTLLWEVLQPGGELPRLLSPGLLVLLNTFYGHMSLAKRTAEMILESWLIPDPPNVKGIRNLAVTALGGALATAGPLLAELDAESKRLKAEFGDPKADVAATK